MDVPKLYVKIVVSLSDNQRYSRPLDQSHYEHCCLQEDRKYASTIAKKLHVFPVVAKASACTNKLNRAARNAVARVSAITVDVSRGARIALVTQEERNTALMVNLRVGVERVVVAVRSANMALASTSASIVKPWVLMGPCCVCMTRTNTCASNAAAMVYASMVSTDPSVPFARRPKRPRWPSSLNSRRTTSI